MKTRYIYLFKGSVFKGNVLSGLVLLIACAASTHASVLSDTAASLRAQQWVELNTLGFNNGDILYTTASTPAAGVDRSNKIIDFAESATWDPIQRQFLFLGAPHGKAWRFIIYDEASNTWRDGPLPHAVMAYGSNATAECTVVVKTSDTTSISNNCGGHAFDWNAIDPATGRFFHHYWKYGPELDIYNVATGLWSRSGSPPAAIQYDMVKDVFKYGAMEWFPDMNRLVMTVAGRVVRVDVDNNQWEQLPTRYSVGTGDTYHNVMEYSPVQKVLVFGGGNVFSSPYDPSSNRKDLYRMDASGTVTRLTDAPFYLRVTGGGAGESFPGSNITVDPVSGKFLVLNKDKQFYELDALANTWRAITNVPAIPAHAVAAAVSNYGVIMYVAETKVWLYKHSDACQNCPPPATPTGLSVTIQ